MPTHFGGTRYRRWFRGAKWQRVPKMYLRGRLIYQLDALLQAFAAAARGMLPPGSGLATPSTRALLPRVGAFVAGPDDPIWTGNVGDAGALDRSDPRLSGLGGLPLSVRSSGAPWRTVSHPDFAEYLFLFAGLEQALLEDGEPIEPPSPIEVEWYRADAPGQPALRQVRGGNPMVYEIIPDALSALSDLRVKEETWRWRCRITHEALSVDLPEEGFVALTVPGVPGLASTGNEAVRGIGVEVDLDLRHATLPLALATYDRPAAEAPPSGAPMVGDVEAALRRSIVLAEDFDLVAFADNAPDPDPDGGGMGPVGQGLEPPAGMAFEVLGDGINLVSAPDRSEVYDRTFSFRRRLGVDWATRGAEDGAQWDMGAFVHMRLRNPEALAVPGAPENLALRAELRSFRLTWDDPDDESIQRYEVQWVTGAERMKPEGSREWTDEDVGHTNFLTTGVLVDGVSSLSAPAALADGDYDVRVRAVNEAGEGPWAVVQGTLPGMVAIPEIERFAVSFDPEAGSARLNWKRIQWAGGPNGIGQLQVRQRKNSDGVRTPGGPWGSWTGIASGFASIQALTQHDVPGLLPDTYYGFQMRLSVPGTPPVHGPETPERGGFYESLERRIVRIDAPVVERPGLRDDPVDMVFRVTLSRATVGAVTLKYADSGEGSATAGTDYEPFEEGALTFAPGETEKTITVTVRPSSPQPDETVRVTLSELMGAVFLENEGRDVEEVVETQTGVGTIIATAGLLIDSPSIGEPESGSVVMTYRIQLRPAREESVSVNVSDTGDGSATAGQDYNVFRERTVTFPAGQTVQEVEVRVLADEEDDEQDETVILGLSNATAGVPIAGARGTGTILGGEKDMDGNNYRWTISDAGEVTDTAPATLSYTVRMEYIGDKVPVPVYADVEDSGEGTATSGTDYTAFPLTPIEFLNTGETVVSVAVLQDTDAEPDETVILNLTAAESGGVRGVVDRVQGTGTILGEPDVTFEGGEVAEPQDGSTADLTFTVTLGHEAPGGGSVDYADTRTGTATSGEDYQAVQGATLTFAEGEVEKTIEVTVNADSTGESDETVVLQLSNPEGVSFPGGGATLDATGTIRESPTINLSINSPIGDEPQPDGDGFPEYLTFMVTMETDPPDYEPPDPVTVEVADTGEGTATSGVDYEEIAARTLTFTSTQRQRTIATEILPDVKIDHAETVILELSNPSAGATLLVPRGTGTIRDYCHSLPPLNWRPGSGIEGSDGTWGGRQLRARLGVRVHRTLPELDPETICDRDAIYYEVYSWTADPATGAIVTSNQHTVGAYPVYPPTASFLTQLAPGSPPPQVGDRFLWIVVVQATDENTGRQTPIYRFPMPVDP